MFSPDATLQPTASIRGNRRRKQRDDSIQLPKAKRQRSALRQDTFQPLNYVEINEVGGPVNGGASLNGRPPEGKVQANGTTAPKQFSLRGKNKADRRDNRDDSSILSTNDYYEVSHLPALPSPLRSHPEEAYRGIISPEYGYILALKPDEAFVWPYNSGSSFPGSNDFFHFSLRPHAGRRTDSLPLGAFTAKAGNSEPGFLVVFPNSGEISYWETLSSASTPTPGTSANGVRGKVSGMLSGEVVTELVNAEPSGFIITFSSGRVAHISLKDLHGRSAVIVQFLRGHNGSATAVWNRFGSLFGGGAWRKDVVAAHSGNFSKGQRDVVIATSDGTFEIWDTRLNTGHTLASQISVGKELFLALKEAGVEVGDEHEQRLDVVDFAFNLKQGSSNAFTKATPEVETDIIVLVSIRAQEYKNYSLVELSVVNTTVTVDVVHPVTCYEEPLDSTKMRPTLCLPKPGLTAFIIFNTAVVLFSLKRFEESPEAQLLMETQSLPQPFQDCVQFREGHYRVLGYAIEDKTQKTAFKDFSFKHPAVVLAVQGFGTVRIAATSTQRTVQDAAEPKVTAKSKLEQAVFFGHLSETPLNLVNAGIQSFSQQEVEQAALELSQEILNSSSRFVKETTTVDVQLKLRAKALHDLASHLSGSGQVLSRSAKWALLEGAEKLAAQRSMWKVEEQHMKYKRHEDKTLLDRILFYLAERNLSVSDPAKGEHDQIRQWFKHDTWRMEYVVPWFCKVMAELREDGMKDAQSTAAQITDGISLCLAALETAFQFRENNAALYGLAYDTFGNGVLTSSYADVPEPWTSPPTTCLSIQKLLTIALEFCESQFQKADSNADALDADTIEKIAKLTPALCIVVDQMSTERARWSADQDDAQIRAHGEAQYQAHLVVRHEQMLKIVALGMFDEAVSLAERFSDMEALVMILDYQKALFEDQKKKKLMSVEDADVELSTLASLEDIYFGKYGDRYAQAYFSGQVGALQLGTMLDDSLKRKHSQYLGKFLAKDPAYTKIAWIHDIISKSDYQGSAGQLELAEAHENDLWSKKVELCLEKLSNLAAAEESGTAALPDTSRVDGQVALIDIQLMLYDYVKIAVGPALDLTAEVELALEELAKHATKDKKALRFILEKDFTALLGREALGVEQIIDLLTLIEPIRIIEGDESEVVGHEFFLALQALSQSGLKDRNDQKSEAEALERVIWRRCLIRDDWEAINKTDMKDDSTVQSETSASALYRTLKECFEAGFWDQDRNTLSSFYIFRPSMILDAEPFPPALHDNYPPEEHELVEADFDTEHETLRQYVEKARLDHWFDAVANAAKAAVRVDADLAGQREAEKFIEEEKFLAADGDLGLIHSESTTTHTGPSATEDVEMEEVGESSLVGAWIDG